MRASAGVGLFGAVVVVCGICAEHVASAQPTPAKPAASTGKTKARRGGLTARLDELSSKVDEAYKAAADLPAALKALQDLQNRVTALKEQLEQATTMKRGYEVVRRKLDDFEDRIGELELKLSAVSLHIAGGAHGNAGYDEGFYIQSADQKFRLRIQGLLQAGYEGQLYSETRLYSGTSLGHDESTFVLRRARLRASGHLLHRRLSFAVELDWGSADVGGPLLHLAGNLRLFRGLQVQAGRIKVPVSRQFLVHSSNQLFVDRAGVVDTFAPGRDLGLIVHGEFFRERMVAYQLGIFNGAGSSFEDNNTDFLWAGRLVVSPFGALPLDETDRAPEAFGLSLGGSFFMDLAPTDINQREGIDGTAAVDARSDQDSDGLVDNVAIYGVAGELAMRYQGLALQGEVFYRIEDPGAVLPENRTYWGMYSQLSYFYEPAAIELGARYGFSQPHHYGLDRSVIRSNKVQELQIVIGGSPWGALVKWQVEYTHRWLRDLERTEASSIDEFAGLQLHQVRLQAQLAF